MTSGLSAPRPLVTEVTTAGLRGPAHLERGCTGELRGDGTSHPVDRAGPCPRMAESLPVDSSPSALNDENSRAKVQHVHGDSSSEREGCPSALPFVGRTCGSGIAGRYVAVGSYLEVRSHDTGRRGSRGTSATSATVGVGDAPCTWQRWTDSGGPSSRSSPWMRGAPHSGFRVRHGAGFGARHGLRLGRPARAAFGSARSGTGVEPARVPRAPHARWPCGLRLLDRAERCRDEKAGLGGPRIALARPEGRMVIGGTRRPGSVLGPGCGGSCRRDRPSQGRDRLGHDRRLPRTRCQPDQRADGQRHVG